jgi:hypothetical protein
MGIQPKSPKSPDLLGLADNLRGYASQTEDAHYISLFLQTAQNLEARARLRGSDSCRPVAQPQPVRLRG